MKKSSPLKKVVVGLSLIVLVLFAVYGLFTVTQYIGYATHSGYGGNIYELVIIHRVPVEDWAGVFGVAVRVEGFFSTFFEDLEAGDLEETNLLFDCLEPDIEHEVYATLATSSSDIDWANIVAATTAQVDTFMGKSPSDSDSATNTFTETLSVTTGSSTVIAPATYTHRQGEAVPASYGTAILYDATNGYILYATVLTNFTPGFNGRTYNYQVLLPTPANTTQRYYFYTDPYDECPGGQGTEPETSFVIGNVSDTSGNRIEGVIVDVQGSTNSTTATGFYQVQPDTGTHYIYAIKEGYEVYQNNVTVQSNTTTIHDITLVEIAVDNPATGPGVSDGTGTGIGPGEDAPGDSTLTGQDEGPGEIPPVPFVEDPAQIEGTDYVISLNDLRRKIRPGEFLQENIYVFSFKKETITVTFELEGNASELIEFDKQTLVLEPNTNDKVTITIYGRAPVGIYNGTLNIDGDINATVPVEIEIVPKDKLPIEALSMDVETARNQVLPGEALKFKTDLRNLLIEFPYAVDILYTIQPVDGGPVVWSETTNTYLRTAFSVIKTAQMPNDLPAGDYILRATARYLGLTSGSSTLFEVKVPFWQRIFLGLRYWHWLLILLGLALIAGGSFWYWRWQESKKKFHLKVEMSELPQPGPRSIPVGKIAETDNKTYFNLEQFKTHCIVAGSTGGGKSVSAQVVIEEALEKDVAVIAFDPTAQWTGMLRPCKDKLMLSLYPLFGMKKTDARGYSGNVRMLLDAREKINIPKFVKPGEIQVFCFHKLKPKDMDVVVSNAIKSIFDSGPQENKALKVMFVFDEVHRLLPKFGGNGSGFLQIERACREFRKWGMGVMLISQVLSDFEGTIKANINTEIQMRTRDEGDLERIRQKYGEDVLRSLVKATVGSGMVENPAYNRGRPYFVAFRPLKHSVERMGDEEIQRYNDYNDKMDNLFYSLDQLEEEGVDVFDLRLELKLALDKVKAGNFNMVDVYLEGLAPRIDKQWEKLGKKPKDFVKELVDMAELEAELAKAQKEKEQADASSPGSAAAPVEEKEIGWKDDVPPDKMLNLANGMIVISLSSLYDEMTAMKEEDFAQHVVEGQKNDFAEWVMNSVGDTKLAYNLYALSDQQKMLEMLEKKKNEEELPDAKPPAWLGGAKPAETQSAEAQPITPEKPTEEAQPTTPADVTTEKPEETQPATPTESLAPAAEGTQPTAAEKTPEEKPSEPISEAPVSETPATPQTPTAPEQAATPVEAQEPTAQPASAPEQTTPEPAAPEKTTTEPEPAQSTPEPTTNKEAVAALSQETSPSATGPYDALIAAPDQAFKLENGQAITSIRDLRAYLPAMEETIFQNHVGQDYNHFADWVQGVFHDDGLASKIRETHSKEELLGILSG